MGSLSSLFATMSLQKKTESKAHESKENGDVVVPRISRSSPRAFCEAEISIYAE